MQSIYSDGAIHNDHHKEINLQGNVSTEAFEHIIKGFFKADDADIIEPAESPSTDNPDRVEKPLVVQINSSQRNVLDKAEKAGIIAYNAERQGYDKGKQSSKALVAYLCGRIFCGDYTKKGEWKEGSRFDDAKYCQELFGFDVAGTRRKCRSTGKGKSPVGHEKVDDLYKEN